MLRFASLPVGACLRTLALTLLLTCWGCDVRRGDDPEPPPAAVAALGHNPAYREVYADSDAEVDRLCRLYGVAAHDEYNRRRIKACVVRSRMETIYGPNPSEKVKAHERAHEQGYDHDGTGRRWVEAQPANVFAGQYDWRQAFAKPAETASAVNIFKGR